MYTASDLVKAIHAKTAKAKGITRLYRYTRYNFESLALLLGPRTIRASNPEYFNDPFDCKPYFDPSAFDSPEAIDSLLGLAQMFMELTKQPKLWDLEGFRTALANPDYRKASIQSMGAAMMRPMGDMYRVICTSTDAFSTLLWSHYADGHKGVCIEFDSTKLPFSTAMQVNYVHEYPKLNLVGATPDVFSDITFLTKADYWSYECEFRVVASEAGPSAVRSTNGMIELPEGAVMSIILGQQFPLPRSEEVRYLIQRYAPNVQLFQMVRDLRDYRLRFTQFDTSRPIAQQTGEQRR